MAPAHRATEPWFRSRRVVATAAAGIVVGVVVPFVVFGASLGGVTPRQIGAGGANVTGCTNTVEVRYVNTVITNSTYRLSQVNLSSIHASCVGAGKNVSVAVSDGTSCGSGGCAEGTVAIPFGTTANVPLTPATFDSTRVNRISIVFTG